MALERLRHLYFNDETFGFIGQKSYLCRVKPPNSISKMGIRFTIAKRAATPAEDGDVRLQPRLEQQPTINIIDFQRGEFHFPSSLSAGELEHTLDDLQRVMLHEMEMGKAVCQPGIGTFRLSLKGDIEMIDGRYHGCDVRVAGINFQPDRKLRSKAMSFSVNQEPYGQAFDTEDDDINQRLTALFANHDTVTHKDVRHALELTLTPHRISALLKRLVSEGRLLREGTGCQTRYRAASGHFGK